MCLLSVSFQNRKGRWHIDLDISAPKLIVPDNVFDNNSAVVVMDLGNFRFKTVSAEDKPIPLEEEGLHFLLIYENNLFANKQRSFFLPFFL